MDSSVDRLVRHSEITFTEVSNQFSRLRTINLTAINLRFAKCAGRILKSQCVSVLMTVVTVYILFADDVRTAVFGVETDEYFFAVATGCYALFVLDMCLACYSRPAYRLSFYFYLDLLASLSLITDIGWIWSLITPSPSIYLQKVGKVSRTGTQTPRVLRILRLLRLIRATRLYKQAKLTRHSSDTSVHDLGVPKESRIGQKLADLTGKRLIVVVLVVILVFPLFDLGFFMSGPYSWEYGLGLMEKTRGNISFLSTLHWVMDYHESSNHPIVQISADLEAMTGMWQGLTPLSSLRYSERMYATSEHFACVVDVRYDTKLAAFLSICQTVLIMLILLCGSMVLTRDATNLVILPIEKMMLKVQEFSVHPLYLLDRKPQDIYDFAGYSGICGLETTGIEEAILRIGALLALGFGQAGARMITANLKLGEVPDVVVEGKKVMAIFAFCDIRNFTDVTEVLGEGVMLFVNEIACILHHTVDQHLGAPNANIGDAFLFVWPLPAADTDYISSSYLSNFADLTLVCILKTIYRLQVDERLMKYRRNAEILKRIENYKVTLGFALHVGWAIEGPIGSLIKIDASYLSPNVNLTMQLQESTKLYGVPLLISGDLYSIFTPETQQLCRKIDTIIYKNTQIRIQIYTFDVDLRKLQGKRKEIEYSMRVSSMKKKKIAWMMRKTHLKVADLFRFSKQLIDLRADSETLFDVHWRRALASYECGNWLQSHFHLTAVLKMRPFDGPALALQRVLMTGNYKPPVTWQGCREV